MGGGARYPYPKEVWSPAGGWWSQPKNWRTNTAVALAGMVGITYVVWTWSSKHEKRYLRPPVPGVSNPAPAHH